MIDPNTTPAIGTTAQAEMTVRASDTALEPAVGDSLAPPQVLATSRMVALMEAAAARVLQPLLSDSQLSIGVAVSVQHSAATAVGQKVYANASLQRCEG